MKKVLFIAAIILLGFAGYSQDSEATQPADTSYWKKGGLASLTFTQVSLSENWAAGGVNSWSVNSLFTAYADYRKDKIVWRNSIEMGFGLINQEDPADDTGDDRITEKTDDRLNIVTDFGYKLSDKLSWSSVLDFRTQFAIGEDAAGNKVSEFFSPAYLLIATGLQWNPASNFSFSYSPVGGKFTFVMAQSLADIGAFGVTAAVRDENGVILTPGKNFRAELGSFVKASFNQEIVENVKFDTRLELFYNYNLNDEALYNDVDVNWQNLLVMKVNDFLTVNWQTQLIYDRDVRFNITEENAEGEASGQFKSVFGVGLAYNFGQTR